MSAVSGSSSIGAVYDRGYRPYDGARGGRSAARAALLRASIRRALGLRRSWRQKIAPWVLLGMAAIPAIVNVGVKYLTRNTPASDVEFITYREYVEVVTVVLLVFVALTAPDIMCPDRRQRVLPLMFARPLTGVDYVLAKVGAMFAIVFAFAYLPQLVLFIGQTVVSEDGALTYLGDNAEILWQAPVSVIPLSLFYAATGTAIASLSARRVTAGASIVGLFLMTSIISEVLAGEVNRPGFEGSPAGLLDFLSLPLVLRDIVFLGEIHPTLALSGVANAGLWSLIVVVTVIAASLALLLYRYDEVER